jgi:hypothetical protein
MPPITIPQAPELTPHTFKVYVLPLVTQEPERLAYVALLLNSFGSKTASYEQATSKVVSLLCSCIPEVRSYLSTNKGEIDFVELDYDGLVEGLSAGRAPLDEDPRDWGYSEIDAMCLSISNPTAIYAAAAVAWMTYAKSAGDSSRTALEEARPKMMKGKYLLSADDSRLFPGEVWGPRIESLEQVNLGMSMFPNVRYLVTAFFLSTRLKAKFTPPNMDPFMLVFDMLKNTGMTHVGAVKKFVEMCPWALKVPELAADFNLFVVDLQKMSLVAPEVRPYHRLLAPQSQYLFLASNLKPLIAVAGSFIEEVDISFRNYIYNAAKFVDLIARVKARAPQNSIVPDVGVLERAFGVQATEPLEATPQQDAFLQQAIVL